ncbi:hypothetical protein CK203_083561 [Vitis vinifera]|uniref:Uncharacterized protein n=1 Tax=Vitis vinifera TaxID=29760 RepID=A0A438BY68_VITVI|nr:hypothetical protein CK203_083561 [Vitis vinifera]
MLQIRLSRDPSLGSGSGSKPLPVETVTVACPDHLVLADLPVAKSLGSMMLLPLLRLFHVSMPFVSIVLGVILSATCKATFGFYISLPE